MNVEKAKANENPCEKSVNQLELDSCRILAMEFPKEFKEIRELVNKERERHLKRNPAPIGDLVVLDLESDGFLLVVGSLVREYRILFPYEGRAKETEAFFVATQKTIKELDGAIAAFRDLNPHIAGKLRSVIATLGKLTGSSVAGFDVEPDDGFGRLRFLQQIAQLRDKLTLYSEAIAFVVGSRPKLKKGKVVYSRGRPPSPYRMPTLELIHMWEGLTGAKASSPKNQKVETGDKATEFQATQWSTKFVQLCLRIIDPSLPKEGSDGVAVSAIKLALEFDSRLLQIWDHAISRYPDAGMKEGFIELCLRNIVSDENTVANGRNMPKVDNAYNSQDQPLRHARTSGKGHPPNSLK